MRKLMMSLAVLAGLATSLLAAPAQAAGPMPGCAQMPDNPRHYYCIENAYYNGVKVGEIRLDITWAATGFGASGYVCVKDTASNGRGVRAQLNFHKYGTPADQNQANYIWRGNYDSAWQECYVGSGTYFSVTEAITDFVNVNWAEHWAGTPYAYRGTFKIYNPVIA